MTDAALDREIARALAVDPSPEFAARVRQRIANEAAPSTWGSRWMVAAGAALAAAAVLLLVILRAPRVASTATTPAMLSARTLSNVGRMPSTTAPAPSSSSSVASAFRRMPTFSRMLEQTPAIRNSPIRHHDVVHEPEILVDPREARAIRALVEGVREGRVDLSAVSRASIVDIERPPVTPLDIPEIVIEPLAPATGEQGARQ
jgi:hypothetical protein